MSNLVPFLFEKNQVRIVVDDNGDPLFVAKDVAEALGYTWNGTACIDHVPAEWRGVTSVLTPRGVQEMAVLTEQGFYFFLNRSDKPGALPLQKKVAGEILPSIRKTGGYGVVQPAIQLPYLPNLELQIAEAAARMLRMSDTSKVRMLASICEIKGVSPAFLPAYVDEDLTRAITQLLKDHGSPLSAKAVNLVLIDMGILAELERKGSRGETKRFKSLTESGLKYGRNETSPQSPRETQPLYYVRTFPELLDLINAHLSKDEAA